MSVLKTIILLVGIFALSGCATQVKTATPYCIDGDGETFAPCDGVIAI